ncbi:MAG: DNA polymerase I [Chitinophagaceae bacterium]|nr:MAG: DNA polymerase I [Chitinophagaceae bacterium]
MKTLQKDKKLFLLDAFALIYRSYFAFSRNPIMNSKGMNTSAIYGFMNTLHDLISNEKPTHLAVVFDSLEKKTDRSEAHSFYKANRQEMPEDIARAIPIIKQILDGMHIPVIEKAGLEADDLIGALAKKSEKDGYTVYMVTPDKDFGQLVSENIFIYKPSYMGKGVEILGEKEILEKWEIKNVKQVIDILGLWGDSSDNIPGIPGVGEKTAKKLISEYGSIENILENSHELKGKLRERVEENKEQALISKSLATIIDDIEIDINEDNLTINKPDKEILEPIFAELEFRTLGKRILGEEFSVNQKSSGQLDLFANTNTEEEPEEKKVEAGKNIENTKHEYHLVKDKKGREKLLSDMMNQKFVAFDTETSGVNPNNTEIVGMSFSMKAGEAFYVALTDDNRGDILKEFKAFFESEKIGKIGQNLKFDVLVLKWYGIEVKNLYFDTMIAHYLLDPETRHNMDVLAENYLGYSPVSIETLIGKKGKNQKSMKDIDIEEVYPYACEDADITLQLKEVFAPDLKKESLDQLFYDIEMPLVQVLTDMEYNGVKLDKDVLEKYSIEIKKDIQGLAGEIFEITDTEFNIDSPKQVGEVLFGKMGLPYKGKKTKSGQFSTNEETLQKISGEHQIVTKLLDYRELVKLKNTYVDALPGLINPKTGKIHSSFNQTIAATGRLSSANPNLQNIPIRTEKGRYIRKAFTATDKNHTLIAADYSQIELRIVASISEDEAMIDAFNKGLDIHTATAAKVFKVDLNDVTSEMRSKAKMVNFGIVYGISAHGLSQRLSISRTEAKELIDAYFEEYPGIRNYMNDSIEFARNNGYVKTLKGRKRFLKDINSRNATVRGFAERNAINTPIQGTSADMIKIAMINVYEWLKKEKMQSRMILQVHDELIFDTPLEEEEKVRKAIREIMKDAIKLKVPVIVDATTGSNWYDQE